MHGEVFCEHFSAGDELIGDFQWHKGPVNIIIFDWSSGPLAIDAAVFGFPGLRLLLVVICRPRGVKFLLNSRCDEILDR